MADEERIVYEPDLLAAGSRWISNVPANDAAPLTATRDVPPELISIWTAPGSARVRLPRVSVPPVSGEIVPALTNTSPVNIPVPPSVPFCELKPLSRSTNTAA